MSFLSKPYLGEFIGRQNIDKLLNDYFSEKVLTVFKNNYPRTPEKQKEKNALCYFLGAYPNLIKKTKKVSYEIQKTINNFYEDNNLYKDTYLNAIFDIKVQRLIRGGILTVSNQSSSHILPSYNNTTTSTEEEPPPPYAIGGSKKRKQVHKKKSKKSKKSKTSNKSKH